MLFSLDILRMKVGWGLWKDSAKSEAVCLILAERKDRVPVVPQPKGRLCPCPCPVARGLLCRLCTSPVEAAEGQKGPSLLASVLLTQNSTAPASAVTGTQSGS